MRPRVPRSSLLLLATIALFLRLAAPAAALSYVMVEDGPLADQADLIAEVRVEAAQPSATGEIPGTDYRVSVLRQ